MNDKNSKCVVLINSGGMGCRFNDNVPKQYHNINEKPIILHCIELFQHNESVDAIFCICEEKYFNYIDNICISNNITKFVKCVKGGKSANESRYNGLKEIEKYVENNDIIVMHDVVRIFIKNTTIDSVISAAKKYNCAVCGQTINANIFTTHDDYAIFNDTPSNGIFVNSMPFACRYEILKKSFDIANDYNNINNSAGPMGIVGAYGNIEKFSKVEIDFLETMKVTYKEDIKIIQKLL